MRRCAALSLATLGAALAGCTAGTGEAGPREAAVEPVGRPACFYARQVVDFRVLDRRNLIVYAPSRSSAYHVQVSPPATELRFADAIGFASRSTRVCGYAGDALYVRDMPDRRYSVIGVYQLDDIGLEQLLGNFGMGPAAEPLEPEAPAGADIEPVDDPDKD